MDSLEPTKSEEKDRHRGISINFHAPCEVINISAADHVEVHIYQADRVQRAEVVPGREEQFSHEMP